MEIKIITLVNLLLYGIIASQSFSYIISLTNVQLHMKAPEYILFRKATDKNFRSKFRLAFYATLISNTILLIVSSNHFTGILFITTVIALLALITDMALALKANMPINNIINTWTADDYPGDWTDYRTEWFRAFFKRQILNLSGFICLLVGVIFS